MATWLPELLSIIAFVIILLRSAVLKKFRFEFVYLYLIMLYGFIIFVGIVYNDVPMFKVFVGLRAHLKHFPLFLLPAVYGFKKYEFKKQLNVILPLFLMQCPIAIFQKIYFYFFKRKFSGDLVQGTLGNANPLAVALICCIAVLYGLYLKKYISLRTFLLLGMLLFVPNTLCESKATIFLLPAALVIPALLCEGYVRGARQRNILTFILATTIFLSVFIPMYNVIMESIPKTARSSYGIRDSFTKMFEEKYLTKYLYRGASVRDTNIRRGDTIVLSYSALENESLTNLLIGIGIGKSFISYLDTPKNDNNSVLQALVYRASGYTLTFLLWEVGFSGLMVYGMFFIFLLKDARLVSKSIDLFGGFALGWCSVLVIMFLSSAYFNTLQYNAIDLLFWYFSGLVAAKAHQIRRMREEVYATRMILERFGKIGMTNVRQPSCAVTNTTMSGWINRNRR